MATGEGDPAIGVRRLGATWPRGYLALAGGGSAPLGLMLALVVGMSALVAVALSSAPVVPGVDPGHWLSVSYPYVGLPTAPDPTDRVLSYPPLMFPILGALVLAFGNPLSAAEALAVGLFAAFGLSLIYLARRTLISAPLQTAMVGLGLGTGSTLQMLFWGGYPNLLGFVLLDLGVVAFLAYLRVPDGPRALAFFGLVGLTFFAHDLTFAVLGAVLALSGAFLLLLGKISYRFLFRPLNLLGGLCLAGIIGGYSLLTSWLQIPHPGYFRSNPSAFTIDEIGELFAPLGHAPALLPAGATVYLEPGPLALVLLSAPLIGLIALIAARELAPSRCDTRLIVATGWFAAVLAVPAAGYFVHVDTDYTRFLYFLPVPFVLLALLSLERIFLGALVPEVAELLPPRSGTTDPGPAVAPVRAASPRRRGNAVPVAWISVAVVLAFVFGAVSFPVIQANEASGTAAAHDPAFLSAMSWLRDQPRSGTVLTVPSAARWTEALSMHDALAVGPVWLLFDQFQIAQAEEAYWELSSRQVVTSADASLSFSGFQSPIFSQAPMYTAYVDSVAFPVFRVLPGSLSVEVSTPNGSRPIPVEGNGTLPGLSPAASGDAINADYPGSTVSLRETAEVGPNGSVRIVFEVEPAPGVSVTSLSLTLATPPSNSPTLATDHPTEVDLSGSVLDWGISGKLGQLPGSTSFTTQVNCQPAPSGLRPSVVSGPGTWVLTVPDRNGSAPFFFSASIATPGASNPNDPLPQYLDTDTLLDAQGVQYLLWPIGTGGASEPAYFAETHGFHEVFSNSEWEILAG